MLGTFLYDSSLFIRKYFFKHILPNFRIVIFYLYLCESSLSLLSSFCKEASWLAVIKISSTETCRRLVVDTAWRLKLRAPDYERMLLLFLPPCISLSCSRSFPAVSRLILHHYFLLYSDLSNNFKYFPSTKAIKFMYVCKVILVCSCSLLKRDRNTFKTAIHSEVYNYYWISSNGLSSAGPLSCGSVSKVQPPCGASSLDASGQASKYFRLTSCGGAISSGDVVKLSRSAASTYYSIPVSFHHGQPGYFQIFLVTSWI